MGQYHFEIVHKSFENGEKLKCLGSIPTHPTSHAWRNLQHVKFRECQSPFSLYSCVYIFIYLFKWRIPLVLSITYTFSISSYTSLQINYATCFGLFFKPSSGCNLRTSVTPTASYQWNFTLYKTIIHRKIMSNSTRSLGRLYINAQCYKKYKGQQFK